VNTSSLSSNDDDVAAADVLVVVVVAVALVDSVVTFLVSVIINKNELVKAKHIFKSVI
jgi:hypothetical protein